MSDAATVWREAFVAGCRHCELTTSWPCYRHLTEYAVRLRERAEQGTEK